LSAVLLLLVGVRFFMDDGDIGGVPGPPTVNIELATPEHIFGSEKEGSQHFASVEVPPVYETIIKKVPIKSNSGSTVTANAPTTYTTKTERVLIPGSDPPRYVSKTVKIENKPKSNNQKYRSDTTRVEKKPPTIEKRRVLGADEVTPELMKSIQSELKERILNNRLSDFIKIRLRINKAIPIFLSTESSGLFCYKQEVQLYA